MCVIKIEKIRNIKENEILKKNEIDKKDWKRLKGNFNVKSQEIKIFFKNLFEKPCCV